MRPIYTRHPFGVRTFLQILILILATVGSISAQTIAKTDPSSNDDDGSRPLLGQVIFGGGLSKPNHAPVSDYLGYYGLLGMTVSRDPGFGLTPDPFEEVKKVKGWTWSASMALRGFGERSSFSQGMVNAHLGRYLLLNNSRQPTTYIKLAGGLQAGYMKLPDVSVRSHILQEFREGDDPQLDLIVIENKSQPVVQGLLIAELVTLYTVKNERLMTRLRYEYGVPLMGDYSVQSDETPAGVVELNPGIRGYQAMELTFAVPSQGVEFGLGAFSQLALRTVDGLNVERVLYGELHLGLLFGGWRKHE